MTPDRYPISTLDAYLRFIRKPVDFAVGLLPGQRSGRGAQARLTVDRLDATIRALLGTVLGADDLHADAGMRRQAADETARAAELQRQVDAVQAQAQGQAPARAQEDAAGERLTEAVRAERGRRASGTR